MQAATFFAGNSPCNSHQPRAKVLVGVKLVEFAIRPHEALLGQVVHGGRIPGGTPDDRADPPGVTVVQAFKGRTVAAEGPLNQSAVVDLFVLIGHGYSTNGRGLKSVHKKMGECAYENTGETQDQSTARAFGRLFTNDVQGSDGSFPPFAPLRSLRFPKL